MKITALAALMLLPSPAHGAVGAGDTFVVPAGETIDEDVYAFAGRVRIEGTVRGDVVAAAGEVVVTGKVTGDVLSFAGSTTVDGEVGGSVRSAAGETVIRGRVKEDVVAASGQLLVEDQARVGRDVLAATGKTSLEGPVEGNAFVRSGALFVEGRVRGDVEVKSERIEIGPQAEITGTLAYESAEPAVISPHSAIGEVTRTEPQGRSALDAIYGWFRLVVGLSLFGLVIGLLSPRLVRAVPEVLGNAPLQTLGFGLLALLAVPLIAVLFFAAGVFVGGWWIGLFALALLLMAVALAFPAVAYGIAVRLIRREQKVLALVAGVAVLALFLQIPVFRGVVAVLAVLFGLGALTRAALGLRRPATFA